MKTNLLRRLFSQFLVGLAPLLAGSGSSAAPLTWFPGAELNETRSSAATVVAPGGSILIFGGTPAGSTDVLVYSGNNVQPLTSPRIAPGAVAMSSGLYLVFGGRQTNGANSITRSVLSYNPVPSGLDDPDVFNVAPMKTARYDVAYAADAAGHAYAIGGLGNNNAVLATVERYDPQADTWTNVANLPSARYHFAAVFDGTNLIYTFGGRTNATSGTETATVLTYNVSANVWSALAPLPVATAGSAAILGPDGQIYVIGGTAGGRVTNLVQVFDPGSGTWRMSTPLPSAVTGAGGAMDTLGRLVVMGGTDANNVDLAECWVSQRLNLPDSPPDFTSSPLPSANCLVPYIYTARAAGNPQPTFQLLTGPDGMEIDSFSGVVTWTPQVAQFGTNSVAVQAANFSGTVTQSWNINTLGPPLAPPANAAVSGYTTNSVSLTWDPTAYVIGPLTYRVYERTFLHNPRGSGGTYIYHLVASTTNNLATIGGLKAGSGYTFVVQSFAAGVTSGYSQPVAVLVPIPAVLTPVGLSPASGGFQFIIQFTGYQASRVQATTNPADPAAWVTIATNPSITGTLAFTDTDANLFPMRFYRVLSP